ncbi:aminoglycoside phosphotransferase family protein [Clostridium intestinale]|uniref:Phosphotransferase enzyme family protein n=1 Tax=Clostridium intestinale DSM 6191 TaxID=1121320 RepID=A0A1M5YWK3_9CLOT|nr:aminoglycoside phosphotransferase family protein [Clostridium intestinale]SHI16244.1 Phosphotransferase enzyme family protein [Clostridium intestinale DSM 6191]
MSEVFYDGNNIYRNLKPYSKTIHKLLRHLENKKINFVPRFLGIDYEKNQEILTFMEGNIVENYPDIDALEYKMKNIKLIANMLKEYHDATVDFHYGEEDEWFLEYKGGLDKEVICHNDIASYNITFSNNAPVGIIDFDTACPAPRIWDIAYAVYRFVPLSKKVYVPYKNDYRDYKRACDSEERKVLIKKFADSYGDYEVKDILENVILRLESLVELFNSECQKGNMEFIKMKNEGHQEFYIEEIKFIKQNMNDWIE